jgi:hypothetical protein
MTFIAQISDNEPADRPVEVDVLITHGPITIKVTEDPGHLRHFWGQLGQVLEQAETPKEF